MAASNLSMEDAQERAMKLLSALGCDVHPISECEDKRADLCASDDNATYLIEVKQKLDDFELHRNHAERMSRGEVVLRSEPVGPNNRIGGIIKHARDQLDSTPASVDTYRLIWFHAGGIDHKLQWLRAFSTFYGRVHLLPLEPLGKPVECYYFGYSSARALPSVDAMVLSNDAGLLLLLNEFSERASLFRRTALYEAFADWKAVVDPQKMVADGEILACCSDVPRKNEDIVLNAMREQTGVRYTVVHFMQQTGTAMVKRGIENE